MAETKLKGTPVHTNGDLPSVGERAPAFTLTGIDFRDRSSSDFAGKTKILTINPSFDTGVCQKAARNFNERASQLTDGVVLMISSDLPTAQKRFCEADGIENAISLSTFRSTFPRDYGVQLVDGPMQGLTARAVLVLDEDDKVLYEQLVDDITQEPDYDAALAAAKKGG